MVNDIVGRFAHVKSDQYEKYGLDKHAVVYIAGSGFSPVDDDDNYKLLFVVTKIVDGLPDEKGGVTISRSNLSLMSDDENDYFITVMEQKLAQQKEEPGQAD